MRPHMGLLVSDNRESMLPELVALVAISLVVVVVEYRG